jgi:hypothetical protein
MSSVSLKSQVGRLKDAVQEYGLIVDGKITTTQNPLKLDYKDYDNLHSIINYIAFDHSAEDLINALNDVLTEDLLIKPTNAGDDYEIVNDIEELLNYTYKPGTAYYENNSLNFWVQSNDLALDVSDYSAYMHFDLWDNGRGQYPMNQPEQIYIVNNVKYTISLDRESFMFTVRENGKDILALDMLKYINSLKEDAGVMDGLYEKGNQLSDLQYEDGRVRVNFLSINAKKTKNDLYDFATLVGFVLVK